MLTAGSVDGIDEPGPAVDVSLLLHPKFMVMQKMRDSDKMPLIFMILIFKIGNDEFIKG